MNEERVSAGADLNHEGVCPREIMTTCPKTIGPGDRVSWDSALL